MKTIKQIAGEIGVSKQAIHEKIKKEPLSSALQGLTVKLDGALLVEPDGESLIKSAFDGRKVSSKTVKLTDNSQALIVTLQAQNEHLMVENEFLRQQLSEERAHSREQSAKLLILTEQAQKLADNAQQLHAINSVNPQFLDGKKKNIIDWLKEKWEK